jgi:hypothetical protein
MWEDTQTLLLEDESFLGTLYPFGMKRPARSFVPKI